MADDDFDPKAHLVGIPGALLLARNVDWNEIVDEYGPQDAPPIYPGSVKDECQLCGRHVWVGPRQFEVLANDVENKVIIACWWCLIRSGVSREELDVRHLGNTI